MTVPKINSAHGSDTRNVINRAIDVLNQQGKTIQDLVAEGQLTEEQYAELITVINGLIKSGHVDKSDLTSEFKGEIEGFSAQLAHKANESEVRKKSVPIGLNDTSSEMLAAIEGGVGTSFNLLSIPRDGSVTGKKTSFMSPSANVFNKHSEPLTDGYYDALGYWNPSTNYLTYFVDVEPGKTYVTNLPPSHLAFFDADMNYIDGLGNGSWTDIIVPANSNISIMTVPVTKTSDISNYCLTSE